MNSSKNNNDIIKKIESEMVKYTDLLTINTVENNENFIPINPTVIPNGYMANFSDMENVTGKNPLVRESIYTKLQTAQRILTEKNPNLTLYATYGYRSLDVQTKIFLDVLSKTNKEFFPNPIELYEEIHRYIAVPTVAGHPTGGAVDITIKNISTGKQLNFGSELYDFSNKLCYVFYKPLEDKAIENRSLLREVMIGAGFAPFDGEWWHFSYGDKEWAYYYNQKNAIFEQKTIRYFENFKDTHI
jgi:D-alanyl-D-alanine dipeptidase